MPKARTAQGGAKQVTISKFFAPKQGPTKLPNGVQIVTDEEEDAVGGNEVKLLILGFNFWPKCLHLFNNDDNNDEVLIKCEPLVLPELSMLYEEKKKKKARTVQQQ